MSASPVGFTTMPKLLPVTGTFALPFTAYFALLSLRVVGQRLSTKRYIGDSADTPADPGADRLYVAARAHANFLENVPLALILAAFAELNGASRRALAGALGALLVLRVVHVEAGMFVRNAMGKGRPLGYFGSLGVTTGLAAYAAWLVKGYWGF